MSDNLVRLSREGSVQEHIEYFINSLEENTTKIRYSNDIKRFLNWKFKGIPVSQLQYKDINSLQYMDIKKFQSYLRRKYASSTVNGNIYAIMSLFKELKKIKDQDGNKIYHLDTDELQVKKIKTTDKEEYGYVEWDEVTEWIDFLHRSDIANKESKAIFLHLARLTGIRKQGLSDLRFKDLRKQDGVYVLFHTLKGKRKKIALKNEDAELLLSLKKTTDPNEKILKMSTKTMDRLMADIRKWFDIPEERNVVLHSLRGLSGWESYLASGKDITAMKNHLGHEDINTSFKYVSNRMDVQTQPTLYMNKDFNNMECIKNLDKEDWQNIFNELSRAGKYEIIHVMESLGYSKK